MKSKIWVPWLLVVGGMLLVHAGTVFAVSVGESSVYYGTSGNIASGGEAPVGWENETQDEVGFFPSSPASTFTFPAGSAGHYLVLYTLGIADGAGTARHAVQGFLKINGTEDVYGYSACYMRGNSLMDNCWMSGAAILDVSDADTLSVFGKRIDSNSNNSVDFSSDSAFSILKLDDSWDYLRLRDVTGGQTINTSTFTDITFDTQDEITSGFSHSGADVTLVSAGHYLVLTSVMLHNAETVTNPRRSAEIRITVDNVEVEGSRASAFLKGDFGVQSLPASYMGIIQTDTAGKVLNVEARCGGQTCTDISTLGSSSIAIVKLPETADYLRVYENGGAQAVDGTADPILWDTDAEEDTLSFVHDTMTNSSRLQIQPGVTTGDYLMFASFYMIREEESSNANILPHWEWRLNGTTSEPFGHISQYNRGADSPTGVFAGGASGGGLKVGLAANDYLELINTETSNNDDAFAIFEGQRYAAQMMSIDSLTAVRPNMGQAHFRWRDDTSSLNQDAGYMAAEDSNNIATGLPENKYRLRISAGNIGTGNDTLARTFELQYGQKVSNCGEITTWTGLADSSDVFDMEDSVLINSDGESVTPGILANSEGYTFRAGKAHDVTDTTASFSAFNASEYTELEYSFRMTTSASLGATYCFRLYDTTNAKALDSYLNYPEISVKGGLNVQKIEGSITGVLSKTETISEPIASLENAFLLFDFTGESSTDNRPDEATCTAYISAVDTITVEKESTSGVCEYSIYVIEALEGEFKVRGRGAIAMPLDVANDQSVTGTANNLDTIGDTGKTFVVGMMRNNATSANYWVQLYTTLELTDSTTVTARRDKSSNSDTNVRYEVVEWLAPGVSVQTGEIFLDDLVYATPQTDAITTVDTARSFVYSTFRHVNNDVTGTGLQVELNSNDVTFTRGITSGTRDSYARWWVIEFPEDGVAVQRGTGSALGSAGNDDMVITIPTAIGTPATFPVNYVTTDDNGTGFPRGRYRSIIDNPTQMTLHSGRATPAGDTAYYAWQAVDTTQWAPFVPDQDTYRFYDNRDLVDPKTASAAENTAIQDFANQDIIRLRMALQAKVSIFPANSYSFKLQYAKADTCSLATSWSDVGAAGGGSAWRGVDNASVADGANIISSLLNSQTNALQSYVEGGTSPVNPTSIPKDTRGEWDFTLQNNGASGGNYCFRMIETSAKPAVDINYTVYPQIEVPATGGFWTQF